MNKLICFASGILLLTACESNSKWEYKVVTIEGVENYKGTYGGMIICDPSPQLNKLGEDGWEAVSSYTEINTVHPNFGNDKYVTGLQPNTRTAVLNIILKRKK